MATTTPPAPEQPQAVARVKTLEEREFDLRAAEFKFNHPASHFPTLPPDHQMNLIWEFCEGIVGSKFICEAARDHIEDIFFIVSMAADLGLKWTHGVRSIYMTPQGKVGMEGNIMLALLYQHKFKVRLKQRTPEVAEYWICRPGDPDEAGVSVPCTFKEAEAFGWVSEKKNPWKDRANMLAWRSLAATARIVAADLLGGVYLPDELEDFEPASVPYNREAEADKAAEANPALELKPKALDAPSAANVIDIPMKAPAKQPEPVLTPQEARNEAFLNRQVTPKVVYDTAPVVLGPSGEGYPGAVLTAHNNVSAPVEPARRTRRAKQEPPAAPAAPKHTPEEIRGMAEANAAEHGITDDDIPRESEPEPEEVVIPPTPPEVDAKAAMSERVNDFVGFVGGTKRHVFRFAFTYLGSQEDVGNMDKMATVMDVLEKVFKEVPDADKPAFLKLYLEDPEQFARGCKVAQNPTVQSAPEPVTPSANPLDEILPDYWSEETCDAAHSAMLARRMDLDKFKKTMSTFDLAGLSDADAHSFFVMFYHHPDTTMLLKRAREKNWPMSSALAFVEGQLKAKLTKQTPSDAAVREITNAITEAMSMEVIKNA